MSKSSAKSAYKDTDMAKNKDAGVEMPHDFDVVVIGGGPSGMMSAGRAAERGLRVLLLEKNDSLGKKLLITGGGRCNVTNAELDNRKLLAKFKDSDKFLFSAFSQYSVKDALDFFHSRNMPTKVENENRVFPESNKSSSVLEVLVKYISEGKVTVQSNTEVLGFIKVDEKIIGVRVRQHMKQDTGQRNSDSKSKVQTEEIYAKSFVLATGGKSHPETGSTGDGFVWLKNIGHKVIEPVASLVPIVIKDKWISVLSGVSINKVKISILQNNVKQSSSIGKILFTHFGVTGPTILNMSKDVSELLKYGTVNMSLDLLPGTSHADINTGLNELFRKESNKKLKNCLKLINESLMPAGPASTPTTTNVTTLPSAIFNTIIELAKVDGEKFAHSVTREERLRLVDALKNMTMEVTGLLGEDKAIVTSGGVNLTEVDFKTMRSRLFPNLYLVGDILNIDRPSGGYSLQLCWTTGYVAGNSI